MTTVMKNTTDTPVPPIPKDLVDYLSKSWPSRDFLPTSEPAALYFHYGARQVITFLEHHYKIQNETVTLPN